MNHADIKLVRKKRHFSIRQPSTIKKRLNGSIMFYYYYLDLFELTFASAWTLQSNGACLKHDNPNWWTTGQTADQCGQVLLLQVCPKRNGKFTSSTMDAPCHLLYDFNVNISQYVLNLKVAARKSINVWHMKCSKAMPSAGEKGLRLIRIQKWHEMALGWHWDGMGLQCPCH